MRTSDFSFLAVLALLAVHIWLRDPSWLTRAEDTLPILAALPIFVWFKLPWTVTKAEKHPVPLGSLPWLAALYVVGVLTNLTSLLALAWTLLLRTWLITRTDARQNLSNLSKLLVLPFLSFPWMSTDLNSLGWAFRLSGAAGVEYLLSGLQFDVVREGTFLWVQGQSISVDAGCSGLNGLQSMLIAGTTLAYLKLKDSPLFWWNVPVLVGAAWLGNTIRIVILALMAAPGGLDIQNNFIHGLAGWGSLCLAFGLCWFLFWLQESKNEKQWRDLARQHDN